MAKKLLLICLIVFSVFLNGCITSGYQEIINGKLSINTVDYRVDFDLDEEIILNVGYYTKINLNTLKYECCENPVEDRIWVFAISLEDYRPNNLENNYTILFDKLLTDDNLRASTLWEVEVDFNILDYNQGVLGVGLTEVCLVEGNLVEEEYPHQILYFQTSDDKISIAHGTYIYEN